MIEGLHLQILAPVDPIYGLKRAVRIGLLNPADEPVYEVAGLLSKADAGETVDGESGVPNPCISVVPVPPAADILGKTASRRRNKGAGRLERQEFHRQRRAFHRFAPASGVGGLG